MAWLRKLWRGWFALFRKEKLDARMDKEMRFHVELQTQENIDAGMGAEDARYAALRQFGWVESVKDACRDQRASGWVGHLAQDLRYGARMLRKNPGFTAVAVITLALGIGATTAIFSLINSSLLRALPYPQPEQLVVVWADNPGLKLGLPVLPLANADLAAWKEGTQTFARIGAFTPATVDLAEDGNAERVGAARVTAGLFGTLGVAPLLGRTFTPEEDQPGGGSVAMISHGLWQRRFGADPALVGKSVSVNGERRVVIGILPPEFDFPRGAEWPSFFPFAGRTEVWLPLAFNAQSWQNQDERGLVAIARLRPGANLRQAQAEMDAFSALWAKDSPGTHNGWTLKVVSLRNQLGGKSQAALVLLFASVALLLLIACVNVANLLLARSAARQKELAVRAALGAAGSRLFRQLLTESLLLSVFGSALGLLVAEGCLRLFLRLNPTGYSRLNETSIDLRVLGFTAVVTLATSAAFGLVPAVQALRLNLRESLHQNGRNVGSAIRQYVRGWLVGSEVALAIGLLAGAGLMVRSFLLVQAVDPGFRSHSVLTFEVQLPETSYGSDEKKAAFFPRLLARLESVAGVRAAGAISYLPLAGGENMGGFSVEGAAPPRRGEIPGAERRWITPGYFAAMGIPVSHGRGVSAADTTGQPLVVVINETLARQFFKSENPVGRRLRVGTDESSAWRTVVGVVPDVKSASLESAIRPQLYIPNAQWPWGGMTVVVSAEGDPLTLAFAARAALKELDPSLPAAKMQTMKQVVSSATRGRRFNMALLAFFAITALVMTVIGIYGVVSFLVGRQIREIGIRVALGAGRADIRRLILRQGMHPVIIGALAGLLGSLAVTRLLASQLYGVSPSDPLTFGVIVALVISVALLACWLPARRATRVAPMVALRCE